MKEVTSLNLKRNTKLLVSAVIDFGSGVESPLRQMLELIESTQNVNKSILYHVGCNISGRETATVKLRLVR